VRHFMDKRLLRRRQNHWCNDGAPSVTGPPERREKVPGWFASDIAEGWHRCGGRFCKSVVRRREPCVATLKFSGAELCIRRQFDAHSTENTNEPIFGKGAGFRWATHDGLREWLMGVLRGETRYSSHARSRTWDSIMINTDVSSELSCSYWHGIDVVFAEAFSTTSFTILCWSPDFRTCGNPWCILFHQGHWVPKSWTHSWDSYTWSADLPTPSLFISQSCQVCKLMSI
jgi:hypothetical protein